MECKKASVEVTPMEAFVEVLVAVFSMKASVKVTKASVEVTFMEAFEGAYVKVLPWKLSWRLWWELLQ